MKKKVIFIDEKLSFTWIHCTREAILKMLLAYCSEKLWAVSFAQKFLRSALCEYASGETMRSEFAHRFFSKGETARTLILRKNLGKLACNNSCCSVGQHIAKVITGVPQGWLHSPSHSPLSQPAQKYKHYM